jgi:hypothetical protein
MKKNTFKLTQGEAILEVILQPTAAFTTALVATGQQAPTPIKVPALLDTGCSAGLMIAESLIKNWQLKTRGWSEVGFPRDQEDRYFALYAWDVDVGIKFPRCSHGGRNVLIESPATMVDLVNSKNSQMLIGQRILEMGIFVYNGPKDYFSLTFPD